jgi:hypothetical protein
VGHTPTSRHAIQAADLGGEDPGLWEHFKYGVIQWWLAQSLHPSQVAKLILLCHIDQDSAMESAALRDIRERFPRPTLLWHANEDPRRF